MDAQKSVLIDETETSIFYEIINKKSAEHFLLSQSSQINRIYRGLAQNLKGNRNHRDKRTVGGIKILE